MAGPVIEQISKWLVQDRRAAASCRDGTQARARTSWRSRCATSVPARHGDRRESRSDRHPARRHVRPDDARRLRGEPVLPQYHRACGPAGLACTVRGWCTALRSMRTTGSIWLVIALLGGAKGAASGWRGRQYAPSPRRDRPQRGEPSAAGRRERSRAVREHGGRVRGVRRAARRS